ncbi:transposase [Pseudomonas aeruginosa]
MRQRSSYPEPFKVQVVQECLQPGATVSSVAVSVWPTHLPGSSS